MALPLRPAEIGNYGRNWGQNIVKAFDLPQQIPGEPIKIIPSENFALSNFLGIDSGVQLNIRHTKPQKGQYISIIEGENGRSVTLIRTPELNLSTVKLSEVKSSGTGRKERRTVEVKIIDGLVTTIRDYRALDTINLGGGPGFVDTSGYIFETTLVDGSLRQSVIREIRRNEVSESKLAEDIVLRDWKILPIPIVLPTDGEESMLPDQSLTELPIARFSGFDK